MSRSIALRLDRLFRVVVPTLLFSTLSFAQTPSPTIANGTYRVSPRHSPDKALDVNGHGTIDGSNVLQWTYGGGTNQQWTVTQLANNEYRIIGVESGKALEAATTSTANGTNVDIRTYTGASNQRWTITATSGGFYRVTPRSSAGAALDVSGNSTANGANVQLWASTGGNNQQWSFQATTSTPPVAVYTFKKGVNISHWLSQNYGTKTYGAPWFDRDDVTWIAQQGFDHIRFPVDGQLWLRPDGSLDLTKIAPFEQALAWARENRLGAVLDMHFLPGASFDPANPQSSVFVDPALQARVADFWRRVASRFASEGANLRFEILNEPVAPQNQQLNPFNTRMLAAIRESNPTRVVYITSNQFSQLTTLPDLAIPNDPNVAITVHYYEPLIFTHQRASWLQLPANMPVVNFPGTVPNLNGILPPNHFLIGWSGRQLTVAQIDEAFQNAANGLRARAPGKEVQLGEFGAFEAGPIDGRRNYLSAVARAAERQGWGWAVWDYQDSFGVRAPGGEPTALLKALLP